MRPHSERMVWLWARLLRRASSSLSAFKPALRDGWCSAARACWLAQQDLPLVRELQAVHQIHFITPPQPLGVQFLGLGQAAGRDLLPPGPVRIELRDGPGQLHLHDGDHAEQEHANRGFLQVLQGDDGGNPAQAGDEAAAVEVEGVDRLPQGGAVLHQVVWFEGVEVIAARTAGQLLPAQIACHRPIPPHPGEVVVVIRQELAHVVRRTLGIEGRQGFGDVHHRKPLGEHPPQAGRRGT